MGDGQQPGHLSALGGRRELFLKSRLSRFPTRKAPPPCHPDRAREAAENCSLASHRSTHILYPRPSGRQTACGPRQTCSSHPAQLFSWMLDADLPCATHLRARCSRGRHDKVSRSRSRLIRSSQACLGGEAHYDGLESRSSQCRAFVLPSRCHTRSRPRSHQL